MPGRNDNMISRTSYDNNFFIGVQGLISLLISAKILLARGILTMILSLGTWIRNVIVSHCGGLLLQITECSFVIHFFGYIFLLLFLRLLFSFRNTLNILLYMPKKIYADTRQTSKWMIWKTKNMFCWILDHWKNRWTFKNV